MVMEKFITNNKKIFRSYKDKQWPFSRSKYLVKPKLTIINEKPTRYLASLHEDQRYVNLAYNDLFEANPNESRTVQKVLLEGDEGIGKTTLCVSVCNDWASEKLFHQFKVLLYLPLHIEKLLSAQSLLELLKVLYPSESQKTCTCVAKHIQEVKGNNVLAIADGWENLHEYEQQTQSTSFLSTLLFGSEYPDMSLLLTVTSSSMSQFFKITSFDRHVKICGFNKDCIKKFIESEVPHKNGGSTLLMQLESNPVVEEVCRIPINCAVICQLWPVHKEALPTTITKFYTRLTQDIVFSHLKKGKYEKVQSFDDIPRKLHQPWKHFCQFAYERIAEKHALFSHQKLSDYFPSDVSVKKSILPFGLLQPSKPSYCGNFPSDFFQFLHPNFQQYLAALHLADQPPDIQCQVLKKFSEKSSFDLVWRFFFGLCNDCDKSSVITLAVQMLCRTKNFSLQLCHCAFEARNSKVVDEVVKALTSKRASHMKVISNFGNSHNYFDSAAIINILANIQECASIAVNFSHSLTERQLHELEHALSRVVQVKELDLSHNNLSDYSLSNLFDKASTAFQSVKKLYLRGNRIENKGIRNMIVSLSRQSSPTLTHLDLSFNPLTIIGLNELEKGVSSGFLSNLEVLFMRQSLTEDPVINIKFLSTFVQTLSSMCQSLQRVDFSANDLGEPCSQAISHIISSLTDLRRDFDLSLNREYMSEVEDNFISVMQKSLREKGKIDHTVVHGVLVGPGRSGKDTLMKRLMNEGPSDPSIISPSTGVLERVVKVEIKKHSTISGADNYVSWRKLHYDEEALELMMSTAKSHSEYYDITDDDIFSDCHEIPTSDVIDYVLYDESSAESLLATGHTDKEASYVVMSTNSETVLDNPANPGQIKQVIPDTPEDMLQRAIKLKSMDAFRDHLESSWTLYLTNTGGQSEYQELLPLLVCGPSVFFVTFPLNNDLNKRYTVRYQSPDGTEKTYESPSTLMDEILQILATIAALMNIGPRHNIELIFKVFFVGTHKDQLPESQVQQIIHEIDDQLQKKIRSTSLYHHNLITFASPNEQLIFTVNNFDVKDDDFQKIRSRLQQVVERTKGFTIKCPSSWLIFSLILRAQSDSRKVLTYNECFTIAKRCGISDRKELNHALFFIHTRLGLVRYFSIEGLNAIVVVDPQVIFDGITTFINETFVSANAELTEIENFTKRGIFSFEVMKTLFVDAHSDSVLPFEWLVKLLMYLNVAAKFTNEGGEEMYFFPSALTHAKEAFSKSCCPSSKSCCPSVNSPPPILIAFSGGFCPRGIPGALLVYLISNEKKSDIFLRLHKDKIFKNQVTYGIGPGDFTFTIFPTHIEVALDPKSGISKLSEVKEACGEAYKQIQRAMDEVTTKYNERGSGYFFAFYCTRDECKYQPHPAEIDWSMNKLVCVVETRRGDFPCGYEVWKNESEGLKDHMAFQESEILGQIADIMNEWEGPIAEKLGLTTADVAGIKLRHQNDLKLQTREALYLWKQKLGQKATRSNLIAVFKEAGRLDLAMNVEKITGEISSLEANESSTKPEHPSALPLPTKIDLPVFPAPTKRIVFTKATSSQLPPGTETIDSSMLSKTDNTIGNSLSTSDSVSHTSHVPTPSDVSSQLEDIHDKSAPDTSVSPTGHPTTPSDVSPQPKDSEGGVGPTSVRADEHQQSNVSRTPPADLMKSDQRGLETSDVEEMVTTNLDPFITEISEHIGLTWKLLARELGFSQTDIDTIEYKDVRNLNEQIKQLFYKWKKREGHKATTDRLLSAIKDAKCEDLLKTLREKRTIIRQVKIEELTDPDGLYIRRRIDVTSDPVGYGFVIRGSRPIYVKSIDPSGPAAEAGLQVGEYLYSVNGQNVLNSSHTDAARIILMGSSTASLVTFIEKDRII